MSKIPSVKGTRDFYPDQMAVRNWIMDGWRAASVRNGFVEYDGPIFEHLQLYTQKSGDEIAGQLFSLTDRGGRDLAIRPEITPTLARMVNQQINSLPRPIKWFSLPRLCRAERPQKGRLREFFQWNIDIIGSNNSEYADADCIYTAVDYLRSVGLTPDDIIVKISSRSMLAALLLGLGFDREQLDTIYVLLDKRPKLPEETFMALAEEKIPDNSLRKKLLDILDNCNDIDILVEKVPDSVQDNIEDLRVLLDLLTQLGIEPYCQFDINIVRGLAYYTGTVFEIFDRQSQLRAICGGGRYDNLLAGLGGPQITATGFGMGDVVLEILLQEKNLLSTIKNELDFFVVWDDYHTFERVGLNIVNQLRLRKYSVAFDYRRTDDALGKQLKQASNQNTKFAIIIMKDEIKANKTLIIKNMATSNQKTALLDDFLSKPDNYMSNNELNT
ncbi:MAG: histidine--tRNA ligase [Sedimentisphaerales bacterium]|nr:histidine--tRNA ligase [Sedimentisphaerales bacterium]